MKKLLSVLFILGSASLLATEASSPESDPAFCFTNPCSINKDFKVKVKVPEQLKLTVKDIDLGLWCGDKDIDLDHINHHTVEGEKGQNVKIGFKDNGLLKFKKGNELVHKFAGTITHKTGSVMLDATTGKGQGSVNVKIPKPGINLLEPGTTYTATATLVAGYDTSAW